MKVPKDLQAIGRFIFGGAPKKKKREWSIFEPTPAEMPQGMPWLTNPFWLLDGPEQWARAKQVYEAEKRARQAQAARAAEDARARDGQQAGQRAYRAGQQYAQPAAVEPVQSLYDVLDVPRTVSSSELRRAFWRAALKTHPDRGGDAESFQKIQNAYGILSSKKRRAAYDMGVL